MQVKSCFDDKSLKMKFLSLSIVNSDSGVTIKQVEEVVEEKTKFLPTTIDATVDELSYSITIDLKDKDGNIVSSKTVTLPIKDVDLTDYVKFTDIATESNLGVVKAYKNGDAYSGVVITKDGEVVLIGSLSRLSDAFFNNPQFYSAPLLSKDLYRWIKVGLIKNDQTWTDEEKASACDTIGAVAKKTYSQTQGSFGTDGAYHGRVYAVKFDGTEETIPVANQAHNYSICWRDADANIYIGDAKQPLHCVNKRVAESLIASWSMKTLVFPKFDVFSSPIVLGVGEEGEIRFACNKDLRPPIGAYKYTSGEWVYQYDLELSTDILYYDKSKGNLFYYNGKTEAVVEGYFNLVNQERFDALSNKIADLQAQINELKGI